MDRDFYGQERLYPTEKEERIYRELKERYGIQDALVIKEEAPDDENQSAR